MKVVTLMNCVTLATLVALLINVGHAQPVKISKLFTVGPNNKEYLLTSISQVNEFAKLVKESHVEEFSLRDRQALNHLLSLINIKQDEILCSQSNADFIRDFFFEYVAVRHREANPECDNDLAMSGEAKSKCLKKAPKPDFRINSMIKKLFIGYGLKVSYICRQHMINSLIVEADNLLEEEDFESLRLWTDKQSVMAKILNVPDDYDDLRLPKNLGRLLNQRQEAGGDSKIYVETASGNVMRNVQLVCRRRFKPIYEKLILPLVTLSSVGFNFKGDDSQHGDGTGEGVLLWYRIVLLCESLRDVEIIENPAIEENQAQPYVRVMSSFEADCLKMTLARNQKEDISDEDLELVVYEPHFGPSRWSDQIIDVQDKSLMRAIKKFKDYQSKLDLIKSKGLRKMAGFIKSNFSRVAVRLASAMCGAHGHLKNQKDYNNFQLVNFMDQFIDQVNNGDDLDDTSVVDRVNMLFKLHLVQIIFVTMSVGSLVLISSAVAAIF